MKIREGFVSNSSSSSFILRGIKLKSEDIIKTLKITPEELEDVDQDEEYEVFEFLSERLEDFDIEVDGNYFGGKDYSTLVVGKSIGSLDDGEVEELKELTEEENKALVDKFEALGFTDIKLKTYIQMVSNDNY